MKPTLPFLEFEFLRAAAELVRQQRELLPQLAETLGVAPGATLYAWMERHFPGIPPCPEERWREESGMIRGTDWTFRFHGFECDLAHRAGGPYLRVELGPRGRPEVLSGYAVLQFVMTSSAAWPEF